MHFVMSSAKLPPPPYSLQPLDTPKLPLYFESKSQLCHEPDVLKALFKNVSVDLAALDGLWVPYDSGRAKPFIIATVEYCGGEKVDYFLLKCGDESRLLEAQLMMTKFGRFRLRKFLLNRFERRFVPFGDPAEYREKHDIYKFAYMDMGFSPVTRPGSLTTYHCLERQSMHM